MFTFAVNNEQRVELSRFAEIRGTALHSARFLKILMKVEIHVALKGWAVVQQKIHTILHAEPSGAAVFQDLKGLRVCEV